MPLDNAGKYRHNTQAVMAADKAAGKPPAPKTPKAPMPMMEDESAHGDSTEKLREAINAWLDEELANESGAHSPDTIENLREAWNAFLDEEKGEGGF